MGTSGRWAGRVVDFYAVLGVAPSASAEEIAHAYRVKAKALHPDVNASPDANDQFARVVGAHEVLGDADRRREYDRERLGTASWVPPRPAGAPARTAAYRGARPRRRGGVVVAIGVTVVVMLGIVLLVRNGSSRSSAIRSGFAIATRTGTGKVTYTTRDGRAFVADDPTAGYGDTRAGTHTYIYYDPKHPEVAYDAPADWNSAFHRLSFADRIVRWYNALYLFGLIVFAVVVYRSTTRRTVY